MTDWDRAEAAVLEARTRALATPLDETQSTDRVDAIDIVVAGRRLAVEASVVHGVTDITALGRLPHAPPALAGLVYHGGVMLPAFHLRAVIGIGLSALPEVARALLVGEPDGTAEMALIVDAITGVRELDPKHMAPLPESAMESSRELFVGVHDRTPILSGRGLLDHAACRVDSTT